MQTVLKPSRIVSPGKILLRELEARTLTSADLAALTGQSLEYIHEVLEARAPLNTSLAEALAEAWGMSTEFWLRLEQTYRSRVEEG